ncbi:MAG: hypothetical protein CMJ70_28065 [Planctomycetaceae bacterium]|nr:hypothetical protein [Planctomycetaceae bacterium]
MKFDDARLTDVHCGADSQRWSPCQSGFGGQQPFVHCDSHFCEDLGAAVDFLSAGMLERESRKTTGAKQPIWFSKR